MSNKKSKTIVEKAQNLVESLGATKLEAGLENKDKEYGSLLHLNTNAKLSTDKYIKPCGDNEDPYNTTPPKEPVIKASQGDFKKINTKSLVANSGFGLIIPALSVLDMAIFVPKQKKRKCFRKSKKKISKNSVENGGICYTSGECKSGKCENNTFGIFEGNCVAKRQTINIEEGGICANNVECKDDLYCNNWWIGLGQCKKSKKNKKNKKK
jgi:hypothetical protein